MISSTFLPTISDGAFTFPGSDAPGAADAPGVPPSGAPGVAPASEPGAPAGATGALGVPGNAAGAVVAGGAVAA